MKRYLLAAAFTLFSYSAFHFYQQRIVLRIDEMQKKIKLAKGKDDFLLTEKTRGDFMGNNKLIIRFLNKIDEAGNYQVA